jgi:sugar/nucleoside kinase (ribokinase family)
MTAPLDYLLIGHIAHDETPDGPRLGGTVAYAAVVAHALGLRVGIVTSARPDEPVLAALPDAIALHLIPAAESTIFVNTYDAQGNRTQIIKGHASALTLADVPAAWRSAPVVHFGTIAHGISPALRPDAFPDALVGVTPQGFMRAWDENGRVYAVPWADKDVFLRTAHVLLSDEDLGHDAALEAAYAADAHCLIVTRGYNGATLYWAGTRMDFPAPPVDQLRHPTGAGDTYAAAFMALLHQHPGDYARAARAAVAIASTYVAACEGEGVPTLAALDAVLAAPVVRAVLQR